MADEPKDLKEVKQYLEDDLSEIIGDSIDMDWQPSWAAKAIVEKLAVFFDEPDLRRIEKALS